MSRRLGLVLSTGAAAMLTVAALAAPWTPSPDPLLTEGVGISVGRFAPAGRVPPRASVWPEPAVDPANAVRG